jgi:hypothetical protein
VYVLLLLLSLVECGYTWAECVPKSWGPVCVLCAMDALSKKRAGDGRAPGLCFVLCCTLNLLCVLPNQRMNAKKKKKLPECWLLVHVMLYLGIADNQRMNAKFILC